MRFYWLLLLAALQACASTPDHQHLYDPTATWDAADASDDECEDTDDDRCLVPACTPAGCGLYRCEDLEPGRIIRTRGVYAVRPPANSQRNWGNSQALPGDALPVMVFQWYRPEELPSQKETERRLALWRDRPHERHHIFPQAFQGFFKWKHINIHEWTLVIDSAEHARVHRLADRGPWNTEWAAWIKREGKTATKAQTFDFGTYLIKKYNLWGMPATYWQTFELPPLPPSP